MKGAKIYGRGPIFPKVHSSKLFLLFLGVGLWARPPDTLYIAWPCTVPSSVANFLPMAEKLFTLPDGRFVLRYWDAPQAWPDRENPRIVAALPALPDTGYPRPDYTVPDIPSQAPSESTTSVLWLILLAILLGLILFHRPVGIAVKRVVSYLYWRLRWEAFLFRYSSFSRLSLPDYAKVLFRLLHPYCDFHPASLVPSEVSRIYGPEPLRLLLRTILPPLYQERYLGEPLSALALQNLYRQLYALLRQSRPYTGAPHQHRLHLCPSS